MAGYIIMSDEELGMNILKRIGLASILCSKGKIKRRRKNCT
jgi:hypothetical protein